MKLSVSQQFELGCSVEQAFDDTLDATHSPEFASYAFISGIVRGVQRSLTRNMVRVSTIGATLSWSAATAAQTTPVASAAPEASAAASASSQSTAAPAMPLAASQAACLPACRSGFACVAGRCVSACNPPCDAGEFCTKDGQCQSTATSEQKNPAAEQQAPAAAPRTHMTNPAMVVGGMVLSSVGGFVGLLGYLRINRDRFRCDNGQAEWCATSKPGVALAITGGVMVGVGIPFIFLGARRVPNHPRVSWVTPPAADRPTLWLGARGLVLSGTF